MNRWPRWIWATVTVTVAAGAYAISYVGATHQNGEFLEKAGGELEWLRRKFELSEEQVGRVRELRKNYAPTYETMCKVIPEANARLTDVIASHDAVGEKLEAAFREANLVHEECRLAMLDHVYRVRAAIGGEKGRAYFEMMMGYIVPQRPVYHPEDSSAPGGFEE